MTIALTFPGQGSQTVGMGQELAEAFPAAREVFEEVDDALDQRLTKIMWEGPADELTLTANAQPALMAASLAFVAALRSEGVEPTERSAFAAGHSLGEYSALAAVGTLSISDTARLLRTRGTAMQAAVPLGEGAMAAVLGLDMEDAIVLAVEAAGGDVCSLANDNAPGQIVLSGSKAAIDRAMDLAKSKGAKRALPLPVSAPFHCAMMGPAADAMAEAFENIEFKSPAIPVVANVTAAPVTDPAILRDLLVQQVTGRVRWRESIAWMADNNVETVIELGTGKVLSGLAKRISRDLNAVSGGNPADVEAVMKALTS